MENIVNAAFAFLTAAGWATSALLKTRSLPEFSADVSRLVGHRRSGSLARIIVALEYTLAAALAVSAFIGPPLRTFVGWGSALTVILLTSTFVLRAITTSNLDCSCFGGTVREGERSAGENFTDAIRDSTGVAVVFARNSAFVAGSLLAANAPRMVPAAVGATGLLLAAALAVAIFRARTEIAAEKHPQLPALRRVRRPLFTTDWRNGVWNPFVMCIPQRD